MSDIIKKTEKAYNTTVKALTKVGEMTPVQETALKKAFYETHLQPSTIKGYIYKLKRHGMPIEEILFAVDLMMGERVGIKQIMLLYENDYSMREAANLIGYKHSHLDFEPVVRKKGPDLAGWISYDNLIFIDKISGNTQDPNVLNHHIHSIEEKLEETQSDMDITEVLYRMKEIIFGNILLEDTAKLPDSVLIELQSKFNYSFETLINLALDHIPERKHIEDIDEDPKDKGIDFFYHID